MIQKQSLQIYNRFIKYNLITRYSIKNFYQIPILNKIVLHLSFKNYISLNKNKILINILLLKYLSNQKPFLTKSTKNILIFKIRKNQIIGCKVTLRKKKAYFFLLLLLKEIFSFFPINVNMNHSSKVLNLKIENLLNITLLKNKFLIFQNISKLDFSLHITNKKKINKFLIFLNEFII